MANVSSANKKDTELSKQLQLDKSAPASQKLVTLTELKVLCRYLSMQIYSLQVASETCLEKKSKLLNKKKQNTIVL